MEICMKKGCVWTPMDGLWSGRRKETGRYSISMAVASRCYPRPYPIPDTEIYREQ
jgi:hypothetical protein